MNTVLGGVLMFGINSQAVDQSNAAAISYDQELPVGGEDLLAAGSSVPTDGGAAASDNPSSFSQTTSQQAMDSPVSSGSNDDLIEIKKDALQQLTPLVGHLEQTPEEKFRTTMMLIQATDDKTLLRTAYQAALQIPDEKVRAQALLDVVNEINYFTHPDLQ